MIFLPLLSITHGEAVTWRSDQRWTFQDGLIHESSGNLVCQVQCLESSPYSLSSRIDQVPSKVAVVCQEQKYGNFETLQAYIQKSHKGISVSFPDQSYFKDQSRFKSLGNGFTFDGRNGKQLWPC